MINSETVRQLALSFEEVAELPHFDKISFRVNRKIFATLDLKNNRACLKLSLTDQSVFSDFNRSVIYPVPNKWGGQGFTFFELDSIRKDMFRDALRQAYCNVAPSRLADKYKTDS